MNIRRYYVPHAIYFLTIVTYKRKPIFADETNLDIFIQTLKAVKDIHPFSMLAYAFLPDHFHLLIKPDISTNVTKILHSVQRNFTINLKKEKDIGQQLHLWQHRFWDHVIRDEADLEQHFDYIHYNPVKHGYVPKPEKWQFSSYQYRLEKGLYPEGWGYTEPQTIADFDFE